jgi:glycerol uptake facilitator-like aquaporin
MATDRSWVVVVVAGVIGTLILIALGVLCFAAYKIKAESFESTTAILKLISFSIKIISPDRGDKS